ncbi:hypothetical protein C1646_749709 [Rhizophagus diaphanus]|nr:hypothetical protein C1646_749709 [Rhizophagus diaphanus] [Rhizophagus sp. MUCL 43196]
MQKRNNVVFINYNYFKPIEKTNEDSREDDENWDSDIYDNMDEDDLLQIDKIEDEENDNIPLLININEDILNITKSNKQLICYRLQSEQISICPIFESICPIISVQDPKHAKKTARNAIILDASLLTFENLSVYDSAAYQIFCSVNLKQLISYDYQLKPEDKADQTFTILNSLYESIVFLVKTHRDFYLLIPLLPWLHSFKLVEHFFGIARQINLDFDFAELIQIVLKISQYTKALKNEKLNFNKEKSVRKGYQFECNFDSIDDNSLEMLRLWPNNNQILQTLNNSYQLARELAEFL